MPLRKEKLPLRDMCVCVCVCVSPFWNTYTYTHTHQKQKGKKDRYLFSGITKKWCKEKSAGLTKKMTASNILLSQRASLGKTKNKKRQAQTKKEKKKGRSLFFSLFFSDLGYVDYGHFVCVIPETLPQKKRKKSDAGNEERCVLQEDLFSS